MKPVVLYLALLAAAVALFLVLPQLDLWTSGLFYRTGRGFPLATAWPLASLHREIGWLAGGIAAILVIAGLWLYLVERPLWRFDGPAIAFAAAATVLGPGLFANTVLKDHWGRARPAQVAAFGGAHQFTPAPIPAGECTRNCSFVSGDAALGFALVAFAFLLPAGRLRRNSMAASLAVGGLIGLARIAQGGHFVSDVVFAGFLVYGTTAVLWWWIVAHDGLSALARASPAALPALRAAPRGWLWTAATAGAAALAIAAVDRPLALALHPAQQALRLVFEPVTRLGLAYPWLVGLGLVFAALNWGGELPRLRPHGAAMRAFAAVPVFLFASVAAAGIAVDLLKVVLGRARPKLLFADGTYGFAWFSLDPRHWSFPSGHAATIAALMAALWWLWPRHLLFYLLVGGIVAVSRILVGAHFLGDVIAGSFIGVAVTRAVWRQFDASGFDLDMAKRGRAAVPAAAPWHSAALRLLRRRRV